MKKILKKTESTFPYMSMLIYLLCAYILTAVILLVLALLLYKVDLSEEVISAGITITYVVAGFVGGFLAGKKMKQKKYIWGLVMGLAYYIVLLLVSLITNHGIGDMSGSIFTTLFLCAGGGMLGGMFS